MQNSLLNFFVATDLYMNWLLNIYVYLNQNIVLHSAQKFQFSKTFLVSILQILYVGKKNLKLKLVM